jgi:hypothetical protein
MDPPPPPPRPGFGALGGCPALITGLGLKCLRCAGLAPELGLGIERRWHPSGLGWPGVVSAYASAAYSALDGAAVQKHWSPPARPGIISAPLFLRSSAGGWQHGTQ